MRLKLWQYIYKYGSSTVTMLVFAGSEHEALDLINAQLALKYGPGSSASECTGSVDGVPGVISW